MSTNEGFLPFRGFKTWYRVVGDGEAVGKLPVVVLHGGPGAAHDYLEPLAGSAARAGLALEGRDVRRGGRCRPRVPRARPVSTCSAARHMNGPSEFHVVGTLRDWDVTDRLDEIAVPALVVGGEFDEATPAINRTVAAALPLSTAVIDPGASHMAHAEDPEGYCRLLDEFLTRVESGT